MSTTVLAWAGFVAFLAAGSSGAGAATAGGFHLARAGRCLATIVAGAGDDFAAGKLAAEIRKFADPVPLIGADRATQVPTPAVIYLGTLRSNPALASVATALGWRRELEKLPGEGYLIRTGVLGGKHVLVLAGGDRTGAIYAAADLKNFYLDRSGDSLAVPALDDTEVPKMRYRWFWNWDNRTNWDLRDHDRVYHHDNLDLPQFPPSFSVRPFYKRPEAYVNNLKMVIDYMSEHKLNGLIIWGFLRDNHGGVQAGQEVCRYANERGVRIIPGVNLDRWYGGIYHEGNHEFNLETRAGKYPELRTMDKEGRYVPRTLCVQKPENHDWIRRGIQWLYDNFAIGGVNLEFAEHTVCYTAECVRARQAQPGSEPDFYKDLARIIPFAAKTAHARAPESWVSYAAYGGFSPEMRSNPPLHILATPDYAICQWTVAGMLADLVPRKTGAPWPEGLRPPGLHSIGYLHWPSVYGKDQKGFYADAFREAARKAYRNGLEGLDTYGEESPDFPNFELNYLAFSEFTYNPEMSDEDFLKRRVAPLYGGEQAGRLALEIARRVGPVPGAASAASRAEVRELAYRGRRISTACGKARWDKMIHYIETMVFQ